jgi:multimeric flavodoxin WrbA
MTKVVVVYHSGYGHAKTVAEHVGRGAEAELLAIDANGDIPEAGWTTLNAADAIILGAPTYMGNASWQFKKFADATSKIWATRGWQDKIFGGFTISASPVGDKGSTIAYLQTLASQHGGIWVSLGLLPSNTKAATADDPNNLGGSIGLLARAPSDAGPQEVAKGDLLTAESYGKRVAAIAARFAK